MPNRITNIFRIQDHQGTFLSLFVLWKVNDLFLLDIDIFSVIILGQRRYKRFITYQIISVLTKLGEKRAKLSLQYFAQIIKNQYTNPFVA